MVACVHSIFSDSGLLELATVKTEYSDVQMLHVIIRATKSPSASYIQC